MNSKTFIKKYSLLVLGCFMLLLLLFFTFFGEFLPFVENNPNRYSFAIPLAYFAHKKVLGAHYIVKWLNGTFAYIPTITIIVLLATLPPILTIDSRPIILMFILAIVELGRVSNMFKLEFDQLSTKEYIQAGISIGIPSHRLLTRYFLPFLYEKLIINMVTDLAKVMFLLGQLGFIGIFISQNLIQVDVGQFSLINNSITWPIYFIDAFRDIRAAAWIPFFPALAITYLSSPLMY